MNRAKSRQVPEPRAKVSAGDWVPIWSRCTYWNSALIALVIL